MRIINKCLSSVLLLTALAAVSSAQKVEGQDKSALIAKSYESKAYPISTYSFPVQIDDRYRFQPDRPENPDPEFEEIFGAPNRLPMGHNIFSKSIEPQGLFPAIGATGWVPPDPDIAVGLDHIVAVVNSSIAFFLKDGTKQFQQTSGTFFSGMGATSFQFDPKAFYDKVHDRYVLLFLERNTSPQESKLLLAISDDGDPNGTWHRYRLEAMQTNGSGQNFWLDYPGFGYNKDAYVVTGNMFGFSSGFSGTQFIVIPSAPLLSGSTATQSSVNLTSSSYQVGEYPDSSIDYVYCVDRQSNTAFRIAALGDLTSGSPSITTSSVAVPSAPGPNRDANSTNGRTLDSIDSRIFNVAFRNGRVTVAHTTNDSAQLGARWAEFALGDWPNSGTPSFVQSGTIFDATTNRDYFTPAVGMNKWGSSTALFAASSTTVPADIVVTGRASDDPDGVMGGATTLESSAGNNYSSGRWGDYFGIDVDPIDDTTFWGIGMGIAANNGWRTSIFSWSVVPATGPRLNNLFLRNSTLKARKRGELRVTLTQPARPGGETLEVFSNHPEVISFGFPQVIAEGQSSARFHIFSLSVSAPTPVTVTVRHRGVVKTVNFTLVP
ncbi:MAG: hypothetical protein KDC26_02595 [Armatimonadetes bacterium]|nr:hypothetical protein [Armatimonadota bacterium]